MEHIDCFHLLACTYKLDRLYNHRTDAECSTASCVTIKLRQYHAVEIKPVVERLRRIHGILTGHRVNHEERLVRIHSILQPFDFVHHLLVYCESTGGIYDNHVIVLCLSLLDGIAGNLHNVLVSFFRIYRHSHLFCHHLQLLDSGRTIHVAGYEQWILMLFVLEHIGELAAERCLTGTL